MQITSEEEQFAIDILKLEEGYRGDIYLDSKGYPTTGYGRLIV